MLETTFNAKIKGENLKDLPLDLYIPPDALEVYLASRVCKAGYLHTNLTL